MSRKKILIFLLIFLLLNITGSFAENNITKPNEQKSIDVSADNFEIQIKGSVMNFSKNVNIKYNNFEAKCDLASVYLEAKTGKVKKIIMDGKVRIQKDNSQIFGEKVIFELENEKITVEGNVKTKIKFNP